MMRILRVTALCLLAVFNVSQAKPLTKNLRKPKKFILDTDAGADDPVAIFLALRYEAAHQGNIKLIAITCTHGNTEEKTVEQNVLKILSIAKRSDIPVYGGAENSLIGKINSSHYYGFDGLGDFNFTEKITATVDKSKFAAVALTDLVKQYPGEVTIVTLGSLTNLALAIKLDSTFIQNVGELIVMGLTITGTGNEAPNVKFNFAIDPQSDFIGLNSTRKPITLVPWELSLNFQITKRKEVFGKHNSSAVNFLNCAERIGIKGADPGWTSIDAMSVSTILWPNLVKKFLITNVTPVFDGAAKGSVLVDYRNFTGKPANAKIVEDYDVELFKKKLLKYFSN